MTFDEITTEDETKLAETIKDQGLIETEDLVKDKEDEEPLEVEIDKSTGKKPPRTKKTKNSGDPSFGDYEKMALFLQEEYKDKLEYKKRDIMVAITEKYKLPKLFKIQQWSWAKDRPGKPAIVFTTEKYGVYRNSFCKKK